MFSSIFALNDNKLSADYCSYNIDGGLKLFWKTTSHDWSAELLIKDLQLKLEPNFRTVLHSFFTQLDSVWTFTLFLKVWRRGEQQILKCKKTKT